MTYRLSLLMAHCGNSGHQQSHRGRELLSRLAADQGVECAVEGWTPRGRKGPPVHPALASSDIACLSHRDDKVVAGLANCPVGIDLEHARPRHRERLGELLEWLPEPRVRQAILESDDPLAAFYRAWTLHEALYKLACIEGTPPAAALDTRLASLAPHGPIHAWQWQMDGWTLSICVRNSGLCITHGDDSPLINGLCVVESSFWGG
ncbi:4'-phosphopantetheinyl transferase family protein [Vreelandella subglaciescola]|jgi:phosphopantetheinyl transferase|uniref:4'-phosphopantetheinyl transferase superfamily protein n=1 Tax=Vreelandella subglaciescola TaxID=29571 RepID=A0A1M7I6U4_9GAMM|nr:4'-phosphopantetheinyl transferase superfamily protein [Halomonas subglaciescola]SHM36474.1 4'-phosphopantetheinyl transferase superfamily protein [Halomonas subglaciescola]